MHVCRMFVSKMFGRKVKRAIVLSPGRIFPSVPIKIASIHFSFGMVPSYVRGRRVDGLKKGQIFANK